VPHVYARGNDGCAVFRDDGDCRPALGRRGYIAANPVQAGLCRSAADWAWGSHAAVAEPVSAPAWLDVARLLELLGARRPGARRRYLIHVSERNPPERPGPLAAGAIAHYLGARE